ncbi:EamA family transporter RarD [Endozoicomonadaceae bacterium StTr2]
MIDKSPLSGFLLAVFSFVFWGIVPVYFKAVSAVPPLEVLSHRIVWSAILLSVLVLITRKQQEIRSALRDIKTLGWLTLSAILIAANWLTFIWGVSHNHILQTSLGYFITPLVNVLFGFLFFGERLSRFGIAAIVLASVGVFLQVYLVGSLPMVAMLVAVTFGLYGLVRKKIDVKPIPGLTIETFILLPPALVWLGWLVYQGNAHLSVENPDLSLLLVMAGLVTTIPLVTFNMAAKRLSLTVLGMVQYIGPTLSFLIGVYVYNEPMDAHRLTTFALIWLGLAVFSFGSMMSYRKQLAAS